MMISQRYVCRYSGGLWILVDSPSGGLWFICGTLCDKFDSVI
jgi:hypothetical protein